MFYIPLTITQYIAVCMLTLYLPIIGEKVKKRIWYQTPAAGVIRLL